MMQNTNIIAAAFSNSTPKQILIFDHEMFQYLIGQSQQNKVSRISTHNMLLCIITKM
jgi:hypothetical protein